MAEDMMNNKPKKAPRQKWEIHWSAKIPLKVLQAIWGAVKIAAGAFVVRVSGRELQLLAMTEEELRLGGIVEKVELVV